MKKGLTEENYLFSVAQHYADKVTFKKACRSVKAAGSIFFKLFWARMQNLLVENVLN